MKTLRNRLIFGFVILLLATAGFNLSKRYQAPADLRLVLNIPASRIDVFEHGERTMSIPVSAGARGYETPKGTYRINSVIWNPWWHPPKSKWARGEKPTPPGPNNPMGKVKINFAPLYYIHGTLYEDKLGAPASHGCIRMGKEDLLQLTHLIHRYRTPRVSNDLLATLRANDRMTRNFAVKPIRFEVVYRLVEVVDGKLLIHPDVYRSGKESLRDEIVGVLKKQGVEITGDVEQRVAQISKRRNATRLTVPLDELVISTEGE
ncbi:MAG TPA: L,D-transpeptidase [Longimicrobiales bacterium]|nr:L,D-transpeptidase [Longimicrobiales bacterium]